MADQINSSQQTINTLKHAAYWGLGGAALVALAPLTIPTAAVLTIGTGVAAALGIGVPTAAAVIGGVVGYNKPVDK